LVSVLAKEVKRMQRRSVELQDNMSLNMKENRNEEDVSYL